MEELLKALKLIKNTCNGRESCLKCPLFNGKATCYVKANLPCGWELVDEVPKIKLFEEV